MPSFCKYICINLSRNIEKLSSIKNILIDTHCKTEQNFLRKKVFFVFFCIQELINYVETQSKQLYWKGLMLRDITLCKKCVID